jgi:hypothetical protein
MNVTTRTGFALWASLMALGAFAQNKGTLSISADPSTGVCYALGGGSANVLSKKGL